MLVCSPCACADLSRLFTFACLLAVVSFLQVQLVLAGDVAPHQSTPASSTLNRPRAPTQPANRTTTNHCVAEVIDETLYYFSVGYRAFAGALIVPITVCAICGNTLVIYVIKHYHSLRITGNVFLASLAVADVGVSTLAMTFYGLQLLYGRWLFGPVSSLSTCANSRNQLRSFVDDTANRDVSRCVLCSLVVGCRGGSVEKPSCADVLTANERENASPSCSVQACSASSS